MLGYFESIKASEVTVEVAPGDTFVAFTDGVIERRQEAAWFQEGDLSRLIGRSDLDADSLAGLIRQTVVDAFMTPPADDMAILVVRRTPH